MFDNKFELNSRYSDIQLYYFRIILLKSSKNSPGESQDSNLSLTSAQKLKSKYKKVASLSESMIK